jgi:hypothetical protein
MATFLTPKLLLQAISLVCYFIYLFLNPAARMPTSFGLIYRSDVKPCWLVSLFAVSRRKAGYPLPLGFQRARYRKRDFGWWMVWFWRQFVVEMIRYLF